MLISPFKAIGSVSYVLREIEDVTKQRGFLTADIEYVNHKGSNFYSANEAATTDEKDYYKSLNQVIKNEYKGNFNFSSFYKYLKTNGNIIITSVELQRVDPEDKTRVSFITVTF